MNIQRTLYPTIRNGLSRCPGQPLGVFRRPNSEGEIYLTFDDGPDPRTTPVIAERLANRGFGGSFFVTGWAAQRQPTLVRDLLAAGHEIGNHSWNHWDAKVVSSTAWWRDADSCHRWLENTLQRAIHWFRPPYGRLPVPCSLRNPFGRQRLAFWNHDSKDFAMSSTEAWRSWLERFKPAAGDIILLHDTTDITASNIDSLLDRVESLGLKSRALPIAA